jgi:hypothetical protein
VPLGFPIQRDIDIGSLLAILFAQDDPGDSAPAQNESLPGEPVSGSPPAS